MELQKIATKRYTTEYINACKILAEDGSTITRADHDFPFTHAVGELKPQDMTWVNVYYAPKFKYIVTDYKA